MMALALGIILSATILGSKDYNLDVLDPRTVTIEGAGKQQENPGGQNAKLSLSLSSTTIDFGTIRPTTQVLRENIITVTAPRSHSLVAFEDHPLRLEPAAGLKKEDIPDTTCDNGTCRETLASEWTNPFAFGFGFSLEPGKFQQFSNDESSETKRAIINQENNKDESKPRKIFYKVNVSKTQPSGVYSNTITYILVPSF